MKIPAIPISDHYELTEVCAGDRARLSEIANIPDFLYAILNAKIGEDGRRLSVEVSVDEFFEKEALGYQGQNPRTGYIFAIRERSPEKRLMGTVDIFDIDTKGQAEIGYFLAPEAQGRGLASRAIIKAIDYATNNLSVKSLSATVDPENAASCAILERFGFSPTGNVFMSETYTDLNGHSRPRQMMEAGEGALRNALRDAKRHFGYSTVAVAPQSISARGI